MADIFNIAGQIHSTSEEQTAVVASEVKDEQMEKKQSVINQEVDGQLNTPTTGLEDRVHTLEEGATGSGDIEIETNPSGVVAGSGKVTTANAVRGAIDMATGYFECATAAATAAKVITGAAVAGFVLPTIGGSFKVKFAHRNSAANPTLNINATGAKTIYYNGQPAGAGNTWDDNETVDIFFDGTNYQANNVAGNSGDGVFDISVYNAVEGTPATYADLAAALGTNGANVPVSRRKGGMSIKFIVQIYAVTKSTSDTQPASGTQIDYDLPEAGTHRAADFPAAFSTDMASLVVGTPATFYRPVTVDGVTTYAVWTVTKNAISGCQYKQCLLMSATWSIDVADWQGVDDEPTAESENLVKSSGIFSTFAPLVDKSSIAVSGTYQVPYSFKAGNVYKFRYLSDENGSFYTKLTPDGENVDGWSSVTKNTYKTFTASGDAEYIVGYVNDNNAVLEISSLSTNVEGLREDVNGEIDRIDTALATKATHDEVDEAVDGAKAYSVELNNTLKTQIGLTLDFKSASSGSSYFKCTIKNGHTYVVTNNASASCSCALKETEDGEVVQVISSSFTAGNVKTFTASQDAEYIGGYISGTNYNISIVDISDSTTLASKITQIDILKADKNPIFTNFSYIDGRLHPANAQPGDSEWGQYSKPVHIYTGNKVFVTTNPGGYSFTAIAETNALGTSYSKLVGASGRTTTTYTYTADHVMYVSVCGAKANMSAMIDMNSYYASKEELNTATTALAADIDELNTKIAFPSYYEENDYLDNKISTINKIKAECGINGDGFIFITDPHMEQNPLTCAKLLPKVLEETTINKVIHGGDAGSVTTSGGWTYIYGNIEKFNKAIYGPTKGKCVFLNVRGNHDFNNKVSGVLEWVDLESTKNIIRSTSDRDIVFSDTADGCYYYYDDKVSHIRYIITDTMCGKGNGQPMFGSTQFAWFVDKVQNVPTGYDIIVIGHISSEPVTCTSNETQSLQSALKIIKAVNNKTAVTISGTTYDFTNFDPNVIINLAGHNHADLEAYVGGVLDIVSINNGGGTRYSTSYNMFESSALVKETGTITEQAFDVFVITDDMVNAVRIGAGGDRYFHREKYTINGASLDLSAEIKHITPTQWMSCNSADIYRTEVEDDVFEWTYPNTIIDVTQAGIVTLHSGGTTGDAMVIAMDGDLNKEFFYIKVD